MWEKNFRKKINVTGYSYVRTAYYVRTPRPFWLLFHEEHRSHDLVLPPAVTTAEYMCRQIEYTRL